MKFTSHFSKERKNRRTTELSPCPPYDTVTFAAPVLINGVRGNLAVVVRQEGENYYKVHRIISPDGKRFDLDKKRDTAETAGGVNENSGLSPTDNVSVDSIPQTSKNVNSNMEQRETVEVMKQLSQETGVVYMITDKYDTGTFLSADLMAVRPGDLNKGIYHQIAKASYFRVFEMNKEAGKDLRAFILDEVEKQIGAEAIAAEIQKIRQQNTVDGKDLTEDGVKDELCSQWLAEILLKNAEGFARGNPDAANLLRKAMQAADGHLFRMIEEKRLDKGVLAYAQKIMNQDDADLEKEHEIGAISKHHATMIEKELREAVGVEIDLSNYTVIIQKGAIEHTLKDHGPNGKSDKTMARAEDFALIPWLINHFTSVEVAKHKDGNPKRSRRYKNSDGTQALMVKLHTSIDGVNYWVQEIVPDTDEKIIYIKSAYKSKIKKDSTAAADMKSSDSQQLTSETRRIAINYSIPNSPENVNSDFAQQVVDRLAAGIKGYRAEQFGYRNGDTVSPIDSDFDPNADWEGYAFTHSDAEEVKAENDGADFAKNFDNLTPEERQQEMAKMRGDI